MSPAAPPLPLTRLDLLHAFLRILLAFSVLLGLVAAMHFYGYYRAERGLLEAREQLNVELARRMIATDITAVVTDPMFVAEDIREQGLLDADASANRGRIAEEFRVFARNKGLYDQIRYLDSQGREAVRVNFDGGEPRIVPAAELQDKSSRYYAEEAMGLPQGGIYLSPLDLNVEGGAVEHPIKPMLRFATPLFDTAGLRRGLLVLNYCGQRLIDHFIQAAANIADHVHLVNGEGYWLHSPDPEDAWGFMFGREETFAGRYPDAWGAITAVDQGQVLDPAGLFTFTSIRPLGLALEAVAGVGKGRGLGAGPPRFDLGRPGAASAATPAGALWHVVSRVDPATLAATPLLFLRRHAALYLAMFALIALGSLLLARAHLRHALAEAQGEYERLFRRTLENIDLVAVSIGARGRVTFCNDHFLKVTGWRRDEAIGEEWAGFFIPAEYREQVHFMIAGAQAPALFPTRHEVPVLAKTGEARLIAWNNTLSFDAAGRFVGITCIGDDVTERRRNEAELRKLSRAVEQSPSIVIITDEQGVIEYVNPKFTEVTGYEPTEVIGRNPRLLKSGETSTAEYRDLWTRVRAGGEWRGEFHNCRKDGTFYWEAASISGIRNPEGAITHFVAVKEDITERKRLEREVEARNRELAHTQSLTALGRMSSMVAHDLRNPLSSVKMAVQILSRQAGDQAETAELGQIALTQIRYMEDILADMLAFARPEALTAEWIDIDKLLEGAVGMAQGKIRQSGVRVSLDIQPGLPPLYGDAGKLRQALCNLIVNAAQAAAGQPDPAIGIAAMLHLGSDGTGVRVEVCDNGGGIEPEARDKLFEPFFTTKAQGTGLGLAIVRRILEQHGAEVRLEPVTPQGTRAAVTLPTRPADSAVHQVGAPPRGDGPTPIAVAPSRDTPMSKVLIVDDDLASCRTLQLHLRSRGHQAATAHSADEGLTAAGKDAPDLVILDIRMPGKSGLEVLPELKSRLPRTPVIMITAFHDMDSTIAAMQQGADDYIHKPIDIDELDAAIDRLLQPRDSAGDISVTPAAAGRDGARAMVGRSREMKEVFKTIGLVAKGPATVLITGASGTGKELVARAIHRAGGHPTGPFVAVNCAALVETLLESDMFGHERGAFTGAATRQIGKFALARDGTIFLDEVGELSPAMQAKLLRVLQEKEFTPLGARQTERSNARVIAATNRDLAQRVAEGRFREDLYYRLQVVSIHLPPLRQRREDIPPLAQTLLARINRDLNRNVSHIAGDAMACLERYPWPGNVRELENVLM